MVIVVYLLIILAAVTQSATTKLFNRSCSHSVVFNAIKACTSVKKFAVPFASPDNTPYRFPLIVRSSEREIFLSAEAVNTAEHRSMANSMNSLL